jgi:DNA-binding MarR family transcriptional regulator
VAEFIDLVAASARSNKQRDRVARAANLTITGASLAALRLVHRHGPIGGTEIAQRLGLDQSTASRQLRALEEHALTERSTDAEDRRVALLSITDAGLDVLRRVREVQLNDLSTALAHWNEDDRTALADLLDRFRTDLLAVRTDETGWSVSSP